jgi:hypothetical protein
MSRWDVTGAALGAVMVFSDIVLEWRGPRYSPWIGDEAVLGNLNHAGSAILFSAAIAAALSRIPWRKKRTRPSR